MTTKRLQDIWREQVDAGRRIRADHGIVAALDDLVGEKIDTVALTASTRPEFAQQLPSFVAEVRRIFSPDEFRAYLNLRQRMLDNEDNDRGEGEDDVVMPENRERDREWFARSKELLLVEGLGTA